VTGLSGIIESLAATIGGLLNRSFVTVGLLPSFVYWAGLK
jgi:hypothetical protein